MVAGVAAGAIAMIEDPALEPLRAADTKAGTAPTVQWRLLRQLDLTTGEAPA